MAELNFSNDTNTSVDIGLPPFQLRLNFSNYTPPNDTFVPYEFRKPPPPPDRERLWALTRPRAGVRAGAWCVVSAPLILGMDVTQYEKVAAGAPSAGVVLLQRGRGSSVVVAE